MPRIVRYNLEAIGSKPDFAGNQYWSFEYFDYDTGKAVRGVTTGSSANIGLIPFYLNGGSHEPHDYIFTITELPIRKYDRLVKSWPYAGCNAEDLANYIKAQLAEQGGAE